ncbi:MAG: molybdate ABC transporter substrate-binding protein [Bacteroidetes bacterium GWC2_33_15]|nr:MAG: molybdate ABC transporter substrate-binding protein [Bacteroidetes bacterium GWA2_33_15]OFX50557.1 MAG: molybdate ABC transporter substrate-binding protein [Bacteroidetes bacterium GWC2_33_15]OFX64094.1 MAG: molybdate ABC transporter substrate-binding protein [Bacteroidetes bacterium GWB2_32_14]OFX69706.1 MAG: molybdate ABC transporter substrate-binding protein [Bacteroidetes bacterium GWD2_33_33]HAN19738.1 molybdate ABC transporter substrate-binding protein [Bacteroidales bacterium]
MFANTGIFMKKIKNIFILFPIILFFTGIISSCNQPQSDVKSKISLFAATGTMLAVNEICDSFTPGNTVQIEKNYAASGNLARQIVNGANANIFISADIEWINFLKDNNLLIDTTISVFAKNKLVIICPKNEHFTIDFSEQFDIESIVPDKIAIGDPSYVPVGKYAKRVLDTLGWYNRISNKVILAKDVSSVLHYVELDECDWGIVYYTEALKSEKVKIICEIPENLCLPIQFYIAELRSSNTESKKLYSYFKTNKAKRILEKQGFITEIN